MLPEEFYEEFRKVPIVYWSSGAMEEHGLHNALGVDPYTGYEICLRAVEISGGILFPPVPFAPAYWPGLSREQLRTGKHELYPPGLWVSCELCERLYVELMESLADLGFKVCIAFGGHWPAELLIKEIEKKFGGDIRGMKFWGGGTIEILGDAIDEGEKKKPIGGHGMMWETSMLAAFRPDWVEVDRAARIKHSPLPSSLKKHAIKDSERIAYIANANPAFGERFLNTAAEQLAKIAKEMWQKT
jgi:creatinine amidohydrolase/Fe(II)-dependent formamide hydrolase-like protein